MSAQPTSSSGQPRTSVLRDFLAPVSRSTLPVVAGGRLVTTADGRRVLDLYGGHAVAALGTGTRSGLAR